MGREVPYAFLARVEQEFQAKFGVAAASAPEGSLTRQFGPRLRQHMETLTNNPAEASKLSKVSAQVAEVKSVMMWLACPMPEAVDTPPSAFDVS